ncbi:MULTISPECIES: class II aldolase/adducin family protein [Streptomyces]|uniref:class II aldolase/adducin family protein n=1 Tax=Streptomyces TaxID=1883 RepID=UPI0013171DE0|nr:MULTISPECIES: class II aldolase/adducin family protein [Streptomyces]QGZ47455.1 hypothetical protein GPZ77_02735 [Streptomyces sp. QHH-9511]GGT79507.1 hypothetical protein GCM10010272_24310 [Streptomyces lateritius]
MSTLPPALAAAVGPVPEGVTLPLPPTFDSVEEERRYRKGQLAAGFRIFGRFGFSEGVAEHITVRDPDACAFFEDHGIYDDYRGVVNELDEGDRVAKALGDHKAVILQNHGLLTVGHSVAEAVWWFVTMERSCQAQLLAMAAGTPRLIDRETALITRDQVGTQLAGWFQARPLWAQITASDPDLFD